MAAGADLRALALDDLVALFADAGADLHERIVAECDRRDRLDRARRRRRADPESAAWREAAHAQYLAAESETRGNLLNARGKAAGIDPWALWSGPMWQAERYASWELLRFWEANPRLTVTEYRRQAAVARAAEQDARERAATELPDARVLIGLVREQRAEQRAAFLASFPAKPLDELLGADDAAAWLGIQVRTVYVDQSRGRWPAHDAIDGRSKRWTRRTLVLAMADRHGLGAPGRPRPKRKATS